MTINEIFLSIQGESTFIGLPCIFIRFCGCNLKCSYCDTTYHTEVNYSLTIFQIIERIKAFSPVKLVELTGGEPLIQNEIVALIHLLEKEQYQILIETNGSISLEMLPESVHKIVDIKCPDSGEGDSFLLSNLHYINPERDNLKFVISSNNDYNWVKAFLQQHHLGGQHILLSCVNTLIQPKELAEWIVRDRLDVRFQLQIHKYIWSSDTKGV